MVFQTNAIAAGIGSTVVSDQWWKRPDDEKFLSLESLYASKRNMANTMQSVVVNTHELEVVGEVDEANPTRGSVSVNFKGRYEDTEALPTHWSFGQLSQLSGAPASYLRDLPAPLAADCVQWGLRYNRSRESVKLYSSARKAVVDHNNHVHEHSDAQLRAATGPDYGRIYDWEIIKPVMDLVERSGGAWKIPGMMTGYGNGMATYDPDVPVTLETTTLFASDHDVFMFLVDDRNPIEIGRLPNGEPDLVFRGFYVSNSETGAGTAIIAAFYLRGVCANRCLWGVENFHEIKIRHTKFAPDRFAAEAQPALASFANGSTRTFIEGVEAAKAAEVARDDDARLEFLTKRAGLAARMGRAAMARHVEEEGRPASNVWDMAQAITAVARDVTHQDRRLELEKKAGDILDKVAA